jgi:hypothetical protein
MWPKKDLILHGFTIGSISLITFILYGSTNIPSLVHLASWDLISRPKSLGGWGIRNIHWFSQALAFKSLWRDLFGSGLWRKAIKKKYLKGSDVVFWLRLENYKFSVASNFWRNFLSTLPLLKKWLVWSVGNGSQVLIGQDPFVGSGPHFKLLNALIQFLKSLQVFSLAHIGHGFVLNRSGSRDWLVPVDLGLAGDLDT